ncbi:hypothetical protein H5410_024180 [Solanum commersonii]|uniref:Uncharacterized protein n=1 Tax=Solanum commersonii TaxID=4109 RepID=A0A9J5ZL88_SOLCO|nr:hypothetical protein H5410_024180 [Solanum commersonii]
MCYEVKCSSCGKTGWGGCGRHVPSVYNRIPEGQHCQCKDWPGVKTTGEETISDGVDGGTGTGTGTGDSKPASSCNIL